MYFVTGGAGFIGSNLVAELADRGERVIVCDRLGEGDKWNNLAKRELEDVVDPSQLFDALGRHGPRLRALIHLGAISATTERDGDRLLETNFRLSRDLWHWCADTGTPLIYASSAATYGDGAHGFDDAADRAALARFRPLNGYGWSKHLFDRWVARRVAEGEPAPPQWAGLKFFNVYGPNEYHKGAQASVVWQLFEQIAAGGPARLFRSHRPDYADGEQTRDFVHVDDAVAVVRWLLETPEVNGLFNVGTGQARNFLDLARAIFTAMGEDENVEFVPTPESIRNTYQYFTEATTARLRAHGYNAGFTELEDGVRAYVQDYLLRHDRYR